MDKFDGKPMFTYEEHAAGEITRQIMESYETGIMGRYSHGNQEEESVPGE